MTRRIETVLFDLDGTLLDTAPDMARALNRLLTEQGRSPLPYATVRPQVSHGSSALVALGFGDGLEPERQEALRQRFLALYADDLAVESRPFPGMEQLLDTLESAGRRWGVVTNKPGWLTDPLMESLDLARRAACVVSGDTRPRRKPHPEPMLHAAELAGSPPQRCLYLGDAPRDIEAGRAAGMPTLVALFGYIASSERPEQWGADGMIEAPGELLDWLADWETTTAGC